MKKIIPAVMVALISTTAFANSAPQSDARQADAATSKTRVVNYTCQNDQKVSVRYGFDKNNKPTYAQANLNGKDRFMPINPSRTDETGTVFGDENNFSLMANTITPKNVKKSHMSIQDPASQIIYKDCKTTKKGKKRR